MPDRSRTTQLCGALEVEGTNVFRWLRANRGHPRSRNALAREWRGKWRWIRENGASHSCGVSVSGHDESVLVRVGVVSAGLSDADRAAATPSPPGASGRSRDRAAAPRSTARGSRPARRRVSSSRVSRSSAAASALTWSGVIAGRAGFGRRRSFALLISSSTRTISAEIGCSHEKPIVADQQPQHLGRRHRAVRLFIFGAFPFDERLVEVEEGAADLGQASRGES